MSGTELFETEDIVIIHPVTYRITYIDPIAKRYFEAGPTIGNIPLSGSIIVLIAKLLS